MESSLLGLALIIVSGIVAQWVAWRTHLPSILLLLGVGLLVGQVIDPDELLGDLLMPFVSISVGLILFEGGLELRLRELREVGMPIVSLIFFGIIITWIIATFGALSLLGFSFNAALLLGAILVVTGPTVVGPILRSVRPRGQVGAVLRWEGILNDAIGAVLAVLVFETFVAGGAEGTPVHIITGILKTLGLGLFVGIVAAYFLVRALRYHWVPEHLHVPVTLAIIVAAFTLSNWMMEESGLLTATVMGIYVANQKSVDVRHLVEFKENLRVLLLSILFIILAARLDFGSVVSLGWGSVGFVLLLIVVARPLSVAICTLGSGLSRPERIFLAAMAPRGIVAAAVASVFALRMAEHGLPESDAMAPVVFLVITVTVALYGLTARPLARYLGVAQTNSNGVVFVGADLVARTIAQALQREEFPVMLIDLNRSNVTASKLVGLNAHYGDALSERLVEQLDISEMQYLLAFTANEHANTLAALHFGEALGMRNVFQVETETVEAPGIEDTALPQYLRGNTLFGDGVEYRALLKAIRGGATIKVTGLTEEFGYDSYVEEYGDSAIPLFIVNGEGQLQILKRGDVMAPKAGDKVISLVEAED